LKYQRSLLEAPIYANVGKLYLKYDGKMRACQKEHRKRLIIVKGLPGTMPMG